MTPQPLNDFVRTVRNRLKLSDSPDSWADSSPDSLNAKR